MPNGRRASGIAHQLAGFLAKAYPVTKVRKKRAKKRTRRRKRSIKVNRNG